METASSGRSVALIAPHRVPMQVSSVTVQEIDRVAGKP